MLRLHQYGVAVVCGRCGRAVHTLYARTAAEGRAGRGVCMTCSRRGGTSLTRLAGIGAVRAAELLRVGVASVEDMAALSDARIVELVAKPGSLSIEQMTRWRAAAQELGREQGDAV